MNLSRKILSAIARRLSQSFAVLMVLQGIQLYDSTGAVFEFGVYRTMAGFNGATGGNYSIPMSARYYRTGAVTAGPANSTMTMTVNYQ